MPLVKFTDINGTNYEFDTTFDKESYSTVQAVRLMQIRKVYKRKIDTNALEINADALVERADLLFGFFAHEFFNTYKNHKLAKYYDSKTGELESQGYISLAAMFGEIENFIDVLNTMVPDDSSSQLNLSDKPKKGRGRPKKDVN